MKLEHKRNECRYQNDIYWMHTSWLKEQVIKISKNLECVDSDVLKQLYLTGITTFI